MDIKIKQIINNELLLITSLVHNSPLRDKIKTHIEKIKELIDME